jgi:hypothetical protein
MLFPLDRGDRVETGVELPYDDGVAVDAAGLDFIEHRSLFALEGHAERSGLRAMVLRNASGAVVHLSELLDPRRIRVESPQ